MLPLYHIRQHKSTNSGKNQNYLDRADELDLLSLRFTLDDNPFLDPVYVENLKKEFTGAFYSRFVLGEWVRAEGLIYPHFNPENIDDGGHTFTDSQAPEDGEWVIAADYGTSNATAAGLWCVLDGVGYRMYEYHHDGRKDGQLTDEQHMDNIIKTLATRIPEPIYGTITIVVDPSAASFKATLRRSDLLRPVDANNDVIDGIRNVSSALQTKRILIHESCKHAIQELQSYVWDEKATDERPLKQGDHHADEIRYFCRTHLLKGSPIYYY